MAKRTQLIVLGALVIVLLVVAYFIFIRRQDTPQGVFSTMENYPAIPVENPELQAWKIKGAQKTQYTTSHRNIFNAAPPPPPVDTSKLTPVTSGGATPVDQPPALPVKFFGYGAVPSSGQRRAFLTNGEDVYIVGEGETLLGQFRILHIGNTSLDFEVISSGKRGRAELEWQNPSA